MAEKEYLATRLFRDRSSAEQDYDALVARGYKEGGIVMGVKPRTPEDRTFFDREWDGDRADAASARRGF